MLQQPIIRKFKRIFMCVVLCNMNILLAGTTGKIAGTVYDASGNEPLIGANVILHETVFGATTDLDGNYFIINTHFDFFVRDDHSNFYWFKAYYLSMLKELSI